MRRNRERGGWFRGLDWGWGRGKAVYEEVWEKSELGPEGWWEVQSPTGKEREGAPGRGNSPARGWAVGQQEGVVGGDSEEPAWGAPKGYKRVLKG